MGKYVVAVSGGVDSIALLDMLSATGHTLVVAHFDHGIRKNSHEDAEFVRALAARYGSEFVLGKARLGRSAGEDEARDKRYAFLRETARKHGGRIVTAHHGDDVVETIVHNVTRGTGWRGLAVMGAGDIARPLKSMTKKELIEYAQAKGLEWREDPTNASDSYTRNKIRHHIMPKIDTARRAELVRFHFAQSELKKAIDEEAAALADSLKKTLKGKPAYDRHFFIMADEEAAGEVLRAVLKRETGAVLTRPALHRLLLAIKTGRAGSKHHAGSRVTLRLAENTFGF